MTNFQSAKVALLAINAPEQADKDRKATGNNWKTAGNVGKTTNNVGNKNTNRYIFKHDSLNHFRILINANSNISLQENNEPDQDNFRHFDTCIRQTSYMFLFKIMDNMDKKEHCFAMHDSLLIFVWNKRTVTGNRSNVRIRT